MTVYALKPRFQALLHPCLVHLRKWGIYPNQITLFACMLSLLGGLCILSWPALLFAYPILLGVRMALNALDGMMARKYHLQSRLGTVLNEVGDIFSDLVLYIPWLWVQDLPLGIILHFGIALILNEGAGMYALRLFGRRSYLGPMGKSDRALLISLLSIGLSTASISLEFQILIIGASISLMWLGSLRRIWISPFQGRLP